jgi:hypothetical protein
MVLVSGRSEDQIKIKFKTISHNVPQLSTEFL